MVKISAWQYTAILTVNILSTAILLPPAFMARQAGRDAWVAIIISVAAGVLLAAVVTSLCSRFPELNLLQIGEKLLGTAAGRLLGLLYSFFFILLAAKAIREFASFMATAFMPQTPVEIFSIIMVLACIYPVYQGLEVIGRLSEIIFPVIVFFLLLFLILMAPEFEVYALLPLLQSEPVSLLRGGFIFFAWVGQIFLLGMLYPHLEEQDKAFKGALVVLGTVLFFLAAGSLVIEFIFGFPLSERFTFALLQFIRLVDIAVILERIDAVVIPIWVSGVFVKISFLLYLSVSSLKNTFGLSEYRFLIVPAAALPTALSVVLFESSLEMELFLKFFATVFFLPFFTGIPLLLYLFSLLKV